MSTAETAEPAPITHRRVLRIAIPILLANVTIPILGIVDTAVVGQIPAPEPIAAVGVGAVVLTAVYWIFGFLRMGTAGLTAQAFGRDDQDEVAALLSRALLIGFAGGVLLIAVQGPLFAGAFMISPASGTVEALARDYMGVRIWSAPAAIALYGITGWLIASERTRAVLGLQVWMNGLNIVLDLVFVPGLGWGVTGVAFATFLAEWSGLALGLWLCRDAFRGAAWRARARVLDPARLRQMAAVNGDILIRSALLQAIFVSFLLLGGRLGDVALAANQVLLQFVHVIAYALDGFAFAAEALVGRAFGARSVARIRRAAILASFWGLGFALLLSAGFALLGPTVIEIMARDPGVQEAALEALPWVVVAPLVSLACFMLDGIFIGATRTADMRNMMAVSAALYGVAVLLMMEPLGNHGLWAALIVSFLARALTMALRYPALERTAAG
jgi:MATE family multidrug resistance protein